MNRPSRSLGSATRRIPHHYGVAADGLVPADGASCRPEHAELRRTEHDDVTDVQGRCVGTAEHQRVALVQDGQRPVGVGLFFSLGHSTIVVALSVLIALSAGLVSDIPALREIGGLIGTSGGPCCAQRRL